VIAENVKLRRPELLENGQDRGEILRSLIDQIAELDHEVDVVPVDLADRGGEFALRLAVGAFSLRGLIGILDIGDDGKPEHRLLPRPQ